MDYKCQVTENHSDDDDDKAVPVSLLYQFEKFYYHEPSSNPVNQ